MGWGEYGFNCWEDRGPVLLLFLFYVNVSGKHPRSRLGSQLLTISAPWVTASRSLTGNRETDLEPTTFSSLLLLKGFPFFPP